MLITGIMETIGAISIMPFIKTVVTPEYINDNVYLHNIYLYTKISSLTRFTLFLGVATFVFVVIGYLFRAYTSYIMFKYVYNKAFEISKQLLISYLSKPYEWFLGKNGSDSSRIILVEMQKLIVLALSPSIRIVFHAITAIYIISLLFVINPVIALSAFLFVGITYSLIFIYFTKQRRFMGIELARTQEKNYKTIQQIFGGIKEIKLFGIENNSIKEYEVPAKIHSEKQANIYIIAELPQYIFQCIAFGGIILLLLFLRFFLHKEMNDVLPIIVLYSFSGFKLIPAFQKIYGSLTHIQSSVPMLNNLYRDFSENLEEIKIEEKDERLNFKSKIELKNISFNYPESAQDIVVDFNLEIKAGTKVGFVGSSGSGKSTLADIIIGLLMPKQGNIIVDGVLITEANIRSWQNNISYVPQQIFLTNDTILSNIAFGIPDEKIDINRVKKVADQAELSEFIENKLPNKYYTIIGDRGVRLSGGERQRLGIARALYRNSSLLVFDEATSALDNITEKQIIQSLNSIDKNTTMIIIAHRLNTVKHCEIIYFFDNGKIIGKGSYDELIKNVVEFKKMADISNN
jgi:ABC-type multidrug transport system fused ATPase/permease subunit